MTHSACKPLFLIKTVQKGLISGFLFLVKTVRKMRNRRETGGKPGTESGVAQGAGISTTNSETGIYTREVNREIYTREVNREINPRGT